MKKILLALAALALTTSPSFGHRPSFNVDGHASAESAWQVPNIFNSIVLYDEITCEAPLLWLKYVVPEPSTAAYFSLGVPLVERLERFRPTLAVVAPGLPLPSEELPFDVPKDMGVRVFHTSGLESDEFNEPFTGTKSRILLRQSVTLPEAGIGYVVTWDPELTNGKHWVAVGTKEDFGFADLFRFPKWRRMAKQFHEATRDTPEGLAPPAPCEDLSG